MAVSWSVKTPRAGQVINKWQIGSKRQRACASGQEHWACTQTSAIYPHSLHEPLSSRTSGQLRPTGRTSGESVTRERGHVASGQEHQAHTQTLLIHLHAPRKQQWSCCTILFHAIPCFQCFRFSLFCFVSFLVSIMPCYFLNTRVSSAHTNLQAVCHLQSG